MPGATVNTANCDDIVGDFTDVGSYTGSASPYGTFDQGGNAVEWVETISGGGRITRGGAFDHPLINLHASIHGFASLHRFHHLGFRVAMIPEPTTGLLLATGLAALAAARSRRSLH